MSEVRDRMANRLLLLRREIRQIDPQSGMNRDRRRSDPGVLGQFPKTRVDSMSQYNTGSKSANTSFKSYIRRRALIQTENTVLFRFK
jgi:hypothetical protein